MDEMLLKYVTRYYRRGILTVHITRIWEHWNPDHSDLFGVNFVMIDSQGGTMEGTIPKDKVQLFKNRISEGTIYKLGAYQVQHVRERYKTVDHPWRVVSDSTILFRLNFVMVDRKGGTTEEVIPKDKMEKFKDAIQEGRLHTIERFDIVKAKDR